MREHRHELLDEGFQAELEEMYLSTSAGKEPKRICKNVFDLRRASAISNLESIHLRGTIRIAV